MPDATFLKISGAKLEKLNSKLKMAEDFIKRLIWGLESNRLQAEAKTTTCKKEKK